MIGEVLGEGAIRHQQHRHAVLGAGLARRRQHHPEVVTDLDDERVGLRSSPGEVADALDGEWLEAGADQCTGERL